MEKEERKQRGFKTVPTTELVSNSVMVNLKAKAIILKALGGYQAGALPQANAVVKALHDYCMDNRLVMAPCARSEDIEFVHADDLPEFVKKLTE